MFSAIGSAQNLVVLLLSVAAFAADVFALVDCLRNRPDAFIAAGKRTKKFWTIITALAAPGIVNALGYDVDGLGTFCFGVAFVFIGAVRAASGGGVGWQLWFGGLLMLLGGVNMITPEIGGLIVPLALLILGAVLVFGGAGRRTSP